MLSSKPKRIGIYGGSFDPIHIAHLVIAEQCLEQADLDHLIFVPAARQPLKAEGANASFADRVKMIELAIERHPRFCLDTCEEDRPGPSYTVDTLKHFQTLHPDAELFLILGSDSAVDLPHWKSPDEIARLAHLLIVDRPDAEIKHPMPVFRWTKIASPLMEISSTDIRKRLNQGHSIRYLVPKEVEAHIYRHKLYMTPHLTK